MLLGFDVKIGTVMPGWTQRLASQEKIIKKDLMLSLIDGIRGLIVNAILKAKEGTSDGTRML